MLNLDTNNRVVRYFMWSCDHLPMTVTRDYSVNKTNGVRRNAAYYVENGTTLCHMFWAMLWLPLLASAGAALLVFMIGAVHVEMYQRYGSTYGVAAFFIPEGFVIAVVAAVALIMFALLGASKTGFFKMLWFYLKSVKSRVCPLVQFKGDGS